MDDGRVTVSTFLFISSFNLGLNDGDALALSNVVLPVYNNMPSPATAYQQLVHQYGQVLFNNQDVVQYIDTAGYVPNTDPAYPYPNSSYGRRLRKIAQLTKIGVGLEAATVDIGRWDTHSNQGVVIQVVVNLEVFLSLRVGFEHYMTILGQLWITL